MAAKKRKKTVDKWKKKKWFKIIAPKQFNEVVLGETPAEKETQVINRVVEASLAELMNQRKFRHIYVRFKIADVKNDMAYTKIIGCRVDNAYLKRMVRRRRTKIEAIVRPLTAEGNKVKVTAITICGTRVEKAKEKAIRKIMTETIIKEARKKKFEDFIKELMVGNISNKIFKGIKNIAPIYKIEIAKVELLEEAKQ